MKQKSLPVLVVLALALLGLLYGLRARRAAAPAVAGAQPLLAELEGEEPDLIRVRDREGLHYYRLERRALGWRLTDPFVDEANPGRVESILGPLSAARRELVRSGRELTPGFLEEAGLAPPKGWIELGAGERRLRIEFGGEDVTPERAFVRIGDAVYRVPLGLDGPLAYRADEMRSPFLFRTGPQAVERLVLARRTRAGRTLHIRIDRSGDGGYRLVEPFAARASAVRVRALLGALLSLRADRFHPPGEKREERFAEPWLDVRLVGSYGTERVRITEPRPRSAGAQRDVGVFAKVDGRDVVLEIDPRNLRRNLELPVAGLVDTVLFPFDPGRARRIQLLAGGRAGAAGWVLVSKDPEPGFRLLQPDARPADPGAVADFVAACKTTRVAAILQGAAAESFLGRFQTPAFELRLEPPRELTVPEVQLAFAEGPQGTLLAKRAGERILLQLTGPLQDALRTPWWHFAERVAFRFARPLPAVAVELETGGRTRRYRVDAKRGWVLGREPAPDFEEIYEYLAPLRAAEVLGPAAARLGGRSPLARFHFSGGKTPAGKPADLGTLELYEGSGDGRLWARAAGDLLLFALPRARSKLLAAFLRG